MPVIPQVYGSRELACGTRPCFSLSINSLMGMLSGTLPKEPYFGSGRNTMVVESAASRGKSRHALGVTNQRKRGWICAEAICGAKYVQLQRYRVSYCHTSSEKGTAGYRNQCALAVVKIKLDKWGSKDLRRNPGKVCAGKSAMLAKLLLDAVSYLTNSNSTGSSGQK